MSQQRSGSDDLEAALRECPIILGGCFGEETLSESYGRLDHFHQRGGRVVETAHSYADGEAEIAIGQWLATHPAPRVRVITKVGHPTADGRSTINPVEIRGQAQVSQQRLGVGSLDLVLLHRDDPATSVHEIIDSLHRLVVDGQVVRYGISNWTAGRAQEFVRQARELGDDPVLSYQYSLAVPKAPLWPGTVHLTDDMIDLAARYDTTVLAWAAQARGWFGKSLPDEGEDDPFDTPRNRVAWSAVDQVSERRMCPRSTVALAWALSQGMVRGSTVGAANATEIAESLAACELQLTRTDLAELAAGSSADHIG